MSEAIKAIKRPAIANVQAALKAYYSPDGYIGNQDIKDMFGVAEATAKKLRSKVEDAHIEQNKPRFVPHKVDAELAFEVWGIDIQKLERNWKKQQQLGILESEVR